MSVCPFQTRDSSLLAALVQSSRNCGHKVLGGMAVREQDLMHGAVETLLQISGGALETLMGWGMQRGNSIGILLIT